MSKSNWFSKITPELLAGVSHKDPNKGSVSVDDGIPFPELSSQCAGSYAADYGWFGD